MPLYCFECSECDHILREWRPESGMPLGIRCLRCNGIMSRRYRGPLINYIEVEKDIEGGDYKDSGMPSYCFICNSCDKKDEVLRTMAECAIPPKCEVCGSDMLRDFQSEGHNITGTEVGKTFWSQSLAINPCQTEEHRRKFPNVRVREDGVIGFDSVKERESYCNATGFEKAPGKRKRSATRIL